MNIVLIPSWSHSFADLGTLNMDNYFPNTGIINVILSVCGVSSVLRYSYLEEFYDTKGIIIIRKSKDRQHNGQKKKNQRTNNDLQNITHKTKHQVARISLKTRVELRCFGRVGSSCSTSGTHSCYSSYKPDDNTWIMKGPESAYDKWNSSMVICDTDID